MRIRDTRLATANPKRRVSITRHPTFGSLLQRLLFYLPVMLVFCLSHQ